MLGYVGDETENVALLTSSMSTHLEKKLSVVAPRAAAQHRSIQSPQQRDHDKPEQQIEQAMQERERRQREEGEKGREREKGRKGEGEKKGEERAAEEEGEEEVKKDVTDWVEVRRRTRRKSRKMVQIFVKVDGCKTSVMEMEMSDKVDDIVKRIPFSDRDVYVTNGGRILRRSDRLGGCEIRDGSMIQVTSRMRGGGRHKDKKSKVEKKQVTRQETLKSEGPAILESEKEVVIRMLEETEEYRKIVEDVSGGSDVDVERKMRHWASILQERPRGDIMECGLRWAVGARRKGRDKQQGQRRQAKQEEKTEQEQSKQGKQVRFGEEQQLGKTGAENSSEPAHQSDPFLCPYSTGPQWIRLLREALAKDLSSTSPRTVVDIEGADTVDGEVATEQTVPAPKLDLPPTLEPGLSNRLKEVDLGCHRLVLEVFLSLMGRTTEVRTGRGSTGLVRGEGERCQADETSKKGKGKGNGGKGEHEGKGGGFGSKGFRMAPNMGAGGSHPRPRRIQEREMAEEKKPEG